MVVSMSKYFARCKMPSVPVFTSAKRCAAIFSRHSRPRSLAFLVAALSNLAFRNDSTVSDRRTAAITIRDAIEADLRAIVEIYNSAIASRFSTAQLQPVTVETRREWFHAHSPAHYPIWVAEVKGTIAAWLSFREFLARCAYYGTVEISLYVSEEF